MLFFVLTARWRLALPPALFENGLWQHVANIQRFGNLRAPCVVCTADQFAPGGAPDLWSARVSPGGMRSPTRKTALDLCEKSEEHSLLASVLQPLACPSSQFAQLYA